MRKISTLKTVNKTFIAALIFVFSILASSTLLAQVVTIQLGSGTSTSAANGPGPINIYYQSYRTQIVYTKAEINAAGFNAQGEIQQIGFYVTDAPAQALPNFSIKMKHTTATDASSHDAGVLTTVYTASTYMPSAGAYDMITLTTPFEWNGSGNVLIDICFDPVSTWLSSTGRVRVYSPAITNGSRYARGFTSQCGVATNIPSNIKPQMQMVIKDTCAPLSGSYTIGPTGDFLNFTYAVNSLDNCGISGPVTFNVQSGTYTEQVTIPVITGSSSTNTITFQSLSGDSSDVILTYAPTTSTTNWTVRLNGADYIKFKNLTISTSGTTYGRIVEFINQARYNEFSNNQILMPTTTSGNFAGFYSYTTVNNYNIIQNNRILNGYYGIYLRGQNGTNLESGIEIKNNILINQYVYPVILYYCESPLIEGNNISSNSASTSYRGFYGYYCLNNMRILKNVISKSTNGGMGMYIYRCNYNTHTQDALIANNFIHLNSTSTANYGAYYNDSRDINLHHNSFNHTGTSTSSRCIYMTGTTSTGLVFNNNIFVNNANGYAIYSNVNTSAYSSNYNDLYTSGNNLGYQGGNRTTLTAWQTASLGDTNSISVDPNYYTDDDLHIGSIPLNAAGTPLASVTDDIDGESRNATTPDIGADEFTPSPIDVGASSLVSPLATICLGSSETVTIRVTNYGTVAINLSTNPLIVNGNVSGTNPTIFPPVTINSGTIALGGYIDVSLTSAFNMSVTGTYTFNAISTMTGDGNSTNNVMPTTNITNYGVYSLPANETMETFTPGTGSINSPGVLANGWMRTNTSTFQWLVKNGGTPSSNTGPVIDHTLGNALGIYCYTEASTAAGTAELISPCIDLTTMLNPKLTFWYHMYGASIGSMHIDILSGGSWTNDIYVITGQQQTYQTEAWRDVTIDISSYIGNIIKVRFRGIRGNGYAGDMAFDDVSITEYPNINLGNDTVICQGGSVVLDAGSGTGYTYQWTEISSPTIIGTGQTYTATTSGDYIVLVTNTYGGTDSDTLNVLVGPSPTANAGSNGDVCEGSSYTISGATASFYSSIFWATSGSGSFSNNGTVTPTYTPSAADISAGNVTLILIANAYPPCTNATDNMTLSIHPIPTVSFSGLATGYCVSDPSVTLTGSPSGGTFSGNGISGNTFTPATAGVGTHTITYSYTDAYGCSNSSNQSVQVNGVPSVTFSGLASSYCINDATSTLAGSPSGGTFSGTGISGNTFNPATAGVGTHIITYQFTDAFGCTNTTTQNTTVNSLPTVSFSGLTSPYCANDPSVTLIGSPNGGTFSGLGISGNTFNPSVAGAGDFSITYSYTDANGCSNNASQLVTVNALPTVSFSGLATSYCITDASVTLTGTPNGGSFTGTGITGSTFIPANAGVGTFTITYSYTNVYNCTNTAIQSVTVNALPNVSFTGLQPAYCENDSPASLTGIPSGGTFTGPGMTGNLFSPSTAGSSASFVNVGVGTISNSGTTYPTPYGNWYWGAKHQIIVLASELTALGVTAGPIQSLAFNVANVNSCPGLVNYEIKMGTTTSSALTNTWLTGLNTVYTNSLYQPIDGWNTHVFQTPFNWNGTSNIVIETCFNNSSWVSLGNASVYQSSTSFASTHYYRQDNSTVCSSNLTTGLNNQRPNIKFYAKTAVGIHDIIYTYVVGNSCSNADTQTVIVNPVPTVSFTGLASTYCVNSTSSTLSGNPAGGTFSGAGISGNTFNPSAAGAGTHSITYSYTDGSACSNSAYQSVTVNGLPTVTINGLSSSFCINDAAVTLNGSPSGGTFSGTGVSGSSFNPATAGAGSHSITYSYTDANGCNNIATQAVTVNNLPTVSITNLNSSYCVNATPVTLTGSPSGGTFSGTGVSGGSFNPSSAGTGSHTITYTYTDANGCTNSAAQNVTVNGLPTVSFSGLNSSYCVNASSATLTGSPAGGTFSGTGISGNTFNPSVAGVGTFTISYTATDGNGCSNTANQSVTVNGLPTVSINGLPSSFCINSPAVILNGNPSGGTFSGTGVSGGSFNPASAGAGTHTITYSYTDANGCSNDATQAVTVNNLPTVSITNLNSSYCVNATPITLTGSPSGGTFSGPGVSGGVFNPASAGTGSHTITYTYTDANGCTNSTTQNVTVNGLPTVSFSGLNLSYCVNASSATLTGSPAGGTFSGTGISGNTFNPSVAGVGTFTITYTATDGNGCSNTANQSVTVNGLPTVTITGLPSSFCINSPAVMLNGNPSGGTFSGTGVSGGSFNPALAGSGTHTITYSYTDGNGCSNDATQAVTVHNLPTVSITNLNSSYCVNATPVTLTGSPSGGTFSGNGVLGGVFNPANAGAGNHTITYIYTDGNGCSNTATQNVNIISLPNISFSGLLPFYCSDGAPSTLTGNPTGGTFSGNGISGNTFNPATAGNGGHIITYTYTDGNGCSNSITQNTFVSAPPNVSFSGLLSAYCIDGDSSLLTGSPTGGTFSGNGLIGSIFFPSIAGTGTHIITYSYNDANGCSNAATQSVTVNALPNVSFTGLQPAYCENDPAVTLTGIPSGGTFSGSGMTGNSFSPALAGSSSSFIDVGTGTITNSATTYPAPYGHWYWGAKHQIIILASELAALGVSAGPIQSLAFNVSNVNTSAALVNFEIKMGTTTTSSVTNTWLTGLNTVYTNSSYQPVLGWNTHVFQTPFNWNGSSNIVVETCFNNTGFYTTNASVYQTNTSYASTHEFHQDASNVCPSTSNGTLYNRRPNIKFYAKTGTGIHDIIYNYTDGNSCSNADTQTVIVYPVPIVTFTGLASTYCTNSASSSLTGIPAGGTFSGTGISGNTFNPSVAGAGTFSITYSYTDGNGCSNSSVQNVTVNSGPNVSFSGLASSYCLNSSAVTMIGSPAGGTFSGPGVTLSTFNPAVAGVGTHTITYSYFDFASGCTASSIQSVMVNSLPTVSISGFANPAAYCVNDPAVVLTVSPMGGILSGNGISGNQFNPTVAGPGIHTVTYSYTDANLCTNSQSINVTVFALPNVTLTPFADLCVDASSITLSGGLPWGGTYSGNGVSGGSFNPAVAGAGTHTITYSYSNVNGCVGSASQNITVNALPSPSIVGLASSYCVNSPSIILMGNPAGGTFSGIGVSGGSFSPSIVGPGNYTITYTVTDGNGCTGSTSQLVLVNALPNVTFTGLANTYCQDTNNVILTGIPAGGTFSGNGISGNLFNPFNAGIGTHIITYTYTDANGCTNSSTQTVTVSSGPTVSFSGLLTSYCVNSSSSTLTGNPSGGVFTGPGISGNTFNPAVAGVGTHTIYYIYTDAVGCTGSSNQSVTVNSLPSPTIVGLASAYCENAPTIILIGNPSGGTFSGPGVSGGSFSPSIAGPGNYNITYSYTDGNGCTGDTSQLVVVNALPIVNFTGLAPTYCQDTNSVFLTGIPSGGTFGGNGISGNLFNPFNAGIGIHIITYTYTDANGCTNSSTQSVTVSSGPTVSFSGLLASYCVNSSSSTLTGNPSGGVFTGSGISGNTFNPTIAGAGTHTIFYIYTDAVGCTGSSNQTVTVNSLPTISISGLLPGYCINSPMVSLIGSPSGGTFLGNGVTGNTFDPSLAGVGTHTITYSYTDANSCTNTINQNVTINNLPNVSFAGLASTYCENAASATLSGSPAGGTFSGVGISGSSFNPVVAGTGTHNITYTYSDAFGCSNAATQSTTVIALPTVLFAGLNPSYCSDTTGISLFGSPAGGTFTGTGISGNTFNPNIAGSGLHTITYTFTDINGCSNSSSQITLVNAAPIANAGNDTTVSYGATFQLNGSASGGSSNYTYFWTGTMSVSNPNIAKPTVSNITSTSVFLLFVYDNTSGCYDTSSVTITVIGGTLTVNPTTLTPAICNGSTADLLSLASGGTGIYTYLWSSNPTGFSSTLANPTVAPTVTTTYTVTVTDGSSMGNATGSVTITVDPIPIVTISGLQSSYCLNSSPVTMTGSPTGGAFSGSGVTGNIFTPLSAGIGNHDIIYTYTSPGSAGNPFGCTNSDTMTVAVNTLPTVTFSGLASSYCADVTSVTLTGSPTGGTFSGTGVSGNIFNPSVAGAGTHIITYSYSAGTGCSNSTTQSVVVNALPTVSISGLLSNYCANSPIVTMIGVPMGGTFAGPGVIGNTFNPSIAGAGTHTVTYTYTDGNSCSTAAGQTVTINPLPPVSFSGLTASYCLNSMPATLTGSPAGGTFSGTGITGNNFNPSIAGLGTYSITYTYTDVFGCSNSDIQSVNVDTLPTVAILGLSPSYCVNSGLVTLTGSPAGGTFSGNGVSANTFNPSVAGQGNHSISYSYNDGNGCSNSTSQIVTVNPLPNVSIIGLAPNYCLNDPAIPLNGSPAGGTFNGNGVSGGSFSPSIAGTGIHLITYTYTDANGCSNNATQNVNVNALPNVSFTGLSPMYCMDSVMINLIGIPGGGSFSGNGILFGNIFNPQWAGSGTHTITYSYTATNGCSNSSSQNTTVNNNPVANAGSDIIIFSGQTTALSGSATGSNIAYSWTPTTLLNNYNSPTPTTDPLYSTTVFILTVTDTVTSCQGTDDVEVIIGGGPLSVSATANPMTICSGNSTQLNAIGSGGSTMYSYSWASNPTGFSSTLKNPNVVPTITTTYTVTISDLANTATASIAVTVNPLPNVNFAAIQPQCFGGAPLTLTGLGTPLGGTYSGPGVSGNDFYPSGAGAGSHSLMYTYQNTTTGCSKSWSSTVIVLPDPTVSFTGLNATYCDNATSVPLTGIPTGGIFSGPGITGNSFNPTSAGVGTHSITYSFTDANNCSDTEVQTVTVIASPTVSFTGLTPVYCENDAAVQLTGFPTGGTFSGPGISGNNFAPTLAGAGTHSILYSYQNANGCLASFSQSVTVNAIPVVTISGLMPQYCENSIADTLTGIPYGGSFSGTGITGNIFDPMIAGAGMHNIEYFYSDANGCSNTTSQSVTVNSLPLANAGTDITVPCGGPGLQIGSAAIAGITYNWIPATGLSNASISNPIASPNLTTVYTVEVTETITGCTSTDIIIVNVSGGPTAVVSNDTTICGGNPVTLTASGGTSYVWNTSATTSTINVSPLVTTMYVVTVTSGACSDPDTVIVNVSYPNINLGPDASFCAGNSITLDAGVGFYSYYWNNGSMTPSISVTSSGTYWVSVTDAMGCANIDTINISVKPIPFVSLGPDTSINVKYSITIDAGPGFDAYLWSDFSTYQTMTVYGPQLGTGVYTYWVEVTDKNICTNRDTIRITIGDNTGIVENQNSTTLKVYPNPTKDYVNFEINGVDDEGIRLEVWNTNGQIIYSKRYNNTPNTIEKFDISNYAKGIYYVKVFTNDKVFVEKIVLN